MHATKLLFALALLTQPLFTLAGPTPIPDNLDVLALLDAIRYRSPAECSAAEGAPPITGLLSIIETIKQHSSEDCDFIPWPGKDGDGTKNRCGFTISADGVKVMICGTSVIEVKMKCEVAWKSLERLQKTCTRKNDANVDVAGGRVKSPASNEVWFYVTKDI